MVPFQLTAGNLTKILLSNATLQVTSGDNFLSYLYPPISISGKSRDLGSGPTLQIIAHLDLRQYRFYLCKMGTMLVSDEAKVSDK